MSNRDTGLKIQDTDSLASCLDSLGSCLVWHPYVLVSPSERLPKFLDMVNVSCYPH